VVAPAPVEGREPATAQSANSAAVAAKATSATVATVMVRSFRKLELPTDATQNRRVQAVLTLLRARTL
jgi:hypothetical protein